MLQNTVLIIAGVSGLYVGGRWLVKSASRLASSFGVSALVIGLTVVAWATSAPELVVNLSAAAQGSADVALGNVIGSNIANIGLALGLMALFFTVQIGWTLVVREIPIMIGAALAAYLLALDGQLSRTDGLLLLAGFLGFSAFVYVLVQRERRKIALEMERYEKQEGLIDTNINRLFEFGRLALGLAALIAGANWMIDGATGVARGLGISEFVIGLTLIAVGTSLPELASSLVAAQHGQSEIAVGNLIGSNITNVLAILGATSALTPINVGPSQLGLEIPVMLGFSALTLVFALDRRMRRWEGVVFFAGYAGFTALALLR